MVCLTENGGQCHGVVSDKMAGSAVVWRLTENGGWCSSEGWCLTENQCSSVVWLVSDRKWQACAVGLLKAEFQVEKGDREALERSCRIWHVDPPPLYNLQLFVQAGEKGEK